MTMPFLLTILGIAVLDSLNPSLFVAQFYLITTNKPLPRLATYILGILTVNFLGGLLILAGVRVLIGELIGNLSAAQVFWIQLGLGIVAVGFGVWSKADATGVKMGHMPRSLRPIHTYLLGMVVMINELTTALPYFIALERITAARLDPVTTVGIVALYNLVFSLPLFAFVAVFVGFRARFGGLLTRVNVFIAKWLPRLIKYVAIGVGTILIVNGIFGLFNGRGLF